jgi:hypothetical protein
MTARPEAAVVRDFLARAGRRVTLIASVEGAAAGVVAVLLATVIGFAFRRVSPLGLSVVVGGFVVAAFAFARALERRARTPRIATLVERHAPSCRNLLITADELMSRESRPSVVAAGDEYVNGVVLRQAAQLVGTLDPNALFPARNAFIALIAGAALWAATLALAQRTHAGSNGLGSGGASGTSPAITGVDVVVTPPAYAGQSARTLHDPVRIEALVGSRLRLTVRARASTLTVETLNGRDSLIASGSSTFTSDLVADADGFVSLEPSVNGRAGTKRLIGLSVFPDAPPRARITAPAKDLFLRDAHQAIDVAILADDDIGIASLRLHYTKVSGSGERFTFVEGDVPITITRTDATKWTARTHWSLDSLGLTPGDMVVYRALVTDRRPGSVPSESDSFIAEIVAPGGIAAAGFAVDPEQERYAVSQQMVILKTERLQAQKSAMSAEDYSNAAAEIAIEQRKVRAEFVFMMGGELADAPNPDAAISDLDEEAEAQGESDLAAGRMENRGRLALLRAIRAMSRAATSLTVADLPPALTHERTALAQLEQAFSRSRILLRALSEREKLDLSRRLSGSLSDVSRDVHPSVQPEANVRARELRKSLASIASVASQRTFAHDASTIISSVGASVIRTDPSNKTLQDIAAELSSATIAIDRNRSEEAHRHLESAITRLAGVLRAQLLSAPPALSTLEANRLGGAVSDLLRGQAPK